MNGETQGHLARSKSALKRLLSPYPTLFIPAFRLFGPKNAKDLIVGPDTEIVIDGFPRSANTFSAVAFMSAQTRPVRIAHHTHAEASLIQGARRGLPTVVLVRDPAAALRSLKVVFPWVDENDALRHWLAFYRRLEPLLDRMLVAEFSQVTNDFGAVCQRINTRFGTDFAVFEHSPENVARVYSQIEGISQKLHDGSQTYVARPSELKRKAQNQLNFSPDAALLLQAQALFERFRSVSQVDTHPMPAPQGEAT